MLLAAYGLPLIEARRVRTLDGAVSAAQVLGLPVALKADVAGLLHKTDAGAVALAVPSVRAVRATVREFRSRFGDRLGGVVVQRMSTAGVELIVGAVRDPTFGPLILYGSGGTNAELFGDQLMRLAPLTDVDAATLVRAPRGARLLDGFRGQPACDIGAIIDVLHRVSQLASEMPEVAEVECNPLIATADGAVVVDHRVRLAPVAVQAPSWVRAIRSARAV
jgi:acyl-CoA synthetase (NDP forming)